MFNHFVSKFVIILCLFTVTLGGCAPKQNLNHSTDPNQKISKSTHTAFIPIAIGLAGVAIAFVAGAAGYSHDEPTGTTTVQ